MAPVPVWSSLTAVDFSVASAVIILTLVCLVKISREKWMLIDAYSSGFLHILLLVCPGYICEYEFNVRPNVSHLAVFRIYAALGLGTSYLLYDTRDTRDHSVSGSLLMSRIVCGISSLCVCMSALVIDKQESHSIKTSRCLALSLLVLICWTASQMYRLLASRYYASYAQRDTWTNLHLRLDLFLHLAAATLLLAAPRLVAVRLLQTGPPDWTACLGLRLAGCVCLASTLQAAEATGYMFYSDTRKFFLARSLSASVLLLVALVTNLLTTWSPGALYLQVPGLALWLGNSLLGAGAARVFLQDAVNARSKMDREIGYTRTTVTSPDSGWTKSARKHLFTSPFAAKLE